VTETWATVDREYVTPGKVRWVFVNAPMPQLHPNSPRAAQYATCARRQGKFWQLHDLLFAQQQDWAHLSSPDSVLGALAARAGLDAGRLNACLGDPATAAELAQDAALVARFGFDGAPSFAADGKIVVLGAQPADSFRVALDALLKAHRH
jgi:protein-disulfide isomerase